MPHRSVKPYLDILGLTIEFRPPRGQVEPILAVRNFSLPIHRGEVFALVGSSGSGKTAMALSRGGLLPPDGRAMGGTAVLRLGETENEEGEELDLLSAPVRHLRKLRRGPMAYLFRDIQSQLNPRLTMRQHIRESIELAGKKKELKQEQDWMPVLYEVGLVEPEAVLGRYPDQLPDVVVQRLLLAMALMRGAEFLIADEPTSELDATAEKQILRLFRELADSRGLTILLLTHNFGILDGLADRVGVMFEGRLVERGATGGILRSPKSGYTRALLECVPKLGERRARLGEVDHVTVRDELQKPGASVVGPDSK